MLFVSEKRRELFGEFFWRRFSLFAFPRDRDLTGMRNSLALYGWTRSYRKHDFLTNPFTSYYDWVRVSSATSRRCSILQGMKEHTDHEKALSVKDHEDGKRRQWLQWHKEGEDQGCIINISISIIVIIISNQQYIIVMMAPKAAIRCLPSLVWPSPPMSVHQFSSSNVRLVGRLEHEVC